MGIFVVALWLFCYVVFYYINNFAQICGLWQQPSANYVLLDSIDFSSTYKQCDYYAVNICSRYNSTCYSSTYYMLVVDHPHI